MHGLIVLETEEMALKSYCGYHVWANGRIESGTNALAVLQARYERMRVDKSYWVHAYACTRELVVFVGEK